MNEINKFSGKNIEAIININKLGASMYQTYQLISKILHYIEEEESEFFSALLEQYKAVEDSDMFDFSTLVEMLNFVNEKLMGFHSLANTLTTFYIDKYKQ